MNQSAGKVAAARELLPCPHCGCRVINVRERKTTIVECDDCKALVIHSSRADAFAAWNRRNIGRETMPGAKWKCGDEFLPFHPSASHVPPEYRDGWNRCFWMAAARASADRGVA